MSKTAFAYVTISALAAFGLVACAATSDDGAPSDEPSAAVQDEELRKSITACKVDADCVAVPRGGCCDNGWKEAVNKHHVKAYANATKCALHPPPLCPMYIVNDTRVPRCDAATHRCTMVAVDTAAIQGEWGADGAILTVSAGHGGIEFGCGAASLDAFTFTSPQSFTATGTYTRGTGVMPPPGMEPQPEPATFSGQVTGDTMTLSMTVAGNTSTMTFTRNRQVNLIRCL
jgi:hypothetical protein